MYRALVFAAVISVNCVCACSARALESERIDYNRDVRPILSDNCYACHGPDDSQRQSDLRLDDPQSVTSLLDSNARAVVPGDPERSEVYRRILSQDDDTKMPPPDSMKTLSAAEIEILRQWIVEGATWGQHWAFVQPQRPQLPLVHDTAWTANTVDYFVLARLQRESWVPSPRADKRTLIRRVTLTLTGLPPTAEEVNAFLQDHTPNAYDKLVDRLLDSPRYGEHMARTWLDLARYGDTHGLHLDNERSIWRYRDWVIDAHNRNLAFDQFTIEQLAGDLLPAPTLDQRIATGFHRCNVTTSEGGAIPEEFLARYAVDRVETTAAVWMGLTAGCAACHDHKFDPLTQREFYQLFAYFYNLTEKAMDGNALLPPPSIKAPTLVQQIHQRDAQAELSRVEDRLTALRGLARTDRRAWEIELAKQFTSESPPQDPLVHVSFDSVEQSDFHLVGEFEAVPGRINGAISLDGKTHLRIEDIGDFARTDGFSYGGWVNVSRLAEMTVLSKMHDRAKFRGYDLYLGSGKVFVHLVHTWGTNALRVNTKLPLRKEKWHHVFATYDGSSNASGVKIYINGREQELDVTHDSLSATIRTDQPFRIGQRDGSAPFVGLIDDIRVYDRELSADEVRLLAASNPVAEILSTPIDQRTPNQDRRLVDALLQRNHPEAKRLFEREQQLRHRLSGLENQFPSTLVMQDRAEPRQAYLLVRGQYDQLGEPVVPSLPTALPPSMVEGESRLTLARWLVSPEHPLTARVTVNRIWQQHFGVGLVKSSEDFGSQGEWPSHPDLLDYLATELIRREWDTKSIHRLIVTSAAFQQTSQFRPEIEDPDNRLLARGPRFRLDAEVIRDLALSVSGLLDSEIGGPSVKPYQPSGLWEAVGYPTSTTARFQRDAGSGLYRRGIYTFWKRTSPPPAMQILDAPTREFCTIRRPRTNTPGAALLLMNDVQFIEAARKLAERMMKADDTREGRMQWAYETVLGRVPSSQELGVLRDLLDKNLDAYARQTELADALLRHGDATVDASLDRVRLAAWTLIASTILNLDEAINQH